MDMDAIRRRIAPICHRYGIEKLYLFGSRARNQAKEGSDYDFYLAVPGKLRTLLELSAFRLDLEECLAGEVDIVTHIGEDIFSRNVDRDKVSVYEASCI